MGWYIFGVIALCIVLLLLKNAYVNRNEIYEQEEYDAFGRTYTRKGKFLGYEYSNKVKMPFWLFALLVIAFLIPIVNIALFLGGMIGMLICVGNNNLFIHFSDKSIWSRIGKFLNKNVF